MKSDREQQVGHELRSATLVFLSLERAQFSLSCKNIIHVSIESEYILLVKIKLKIRLLFLRSVMVSSKIERNGKSAAKPKSSV